MRGSHAYHTMLFTGTVAGLVLGDSIDHANFLWSGSPMISKGTGTGAVGATTNVAIKDGALSVTLHLINVDHRRVSGECQRHTLTQDNNTPNHRTLFRLHA